ncbi:hypothetical protein SAMN06265222_10351 [Neorhodopirellula lusitana]|uniref:Uncharacterized protein n=1 Tax=Neorhodopirellula lusitana TaxID=445327 RepID=A0ABY1PWU3_9BACT|nr:hypothetical protein [Neorhodopirellula lusitana]SMP50165.1 hypothetical protein SAMN06265222_10351 [Neorhodopirellula lusitana]
MTLASQQTTASSADRDAEPGIRTESRSGSGRQPSDAIPPTLLRLPDLEPELEDDSLTDASDMDTFEDADESQDQTASGFAMAGSKLAKPSNTDVPGGELRGKDSLAGAPAGVAANSSLDSLYQDAIHSKAVAPNDAQLHPVPKTVRSESSAAASESDSFLSTFASRKALLVIVAIFAGLAIFVPRGNKEPAEALTPEAIQQLPVDDISKTTSSRHGADGMSALSAQAGRKSQGGVNDPAKPKWNDPIAIPPKVAFDRNVTKDSDATKTAQPIPAHDLSSPGNRSVVKQPGSMNDLSAPGSAHSATLMSPSVTSPNASNPRPNGGLPSNMPGMAEAPFIPVGNVAQNSAANNGAAQGNASQNPGQPNSNPGMNTLNSPPSFQAVTQPSSDGPQAPSSFAANSLAPNQFAGSQSSNSQSGNSQPPNSAVASPSGAAEPRARMVQSRTPQGIEDWTRFLPTVQPEDADMSQSQAPNNQAPGNQAPGIQSSVGQSPVGQAPVGQGRVAASSVRASASPTAPDFQFALPGSANPNGAGPTPGSGVSPSAQVTPEARVAMPPPSYMR